MVENKIVINNNKVEFSYGKLKKEEVLKIKKDKSF